MDKKEIANLIVERAYKLHFDNVYSILKEKPFILAGGSLSGDEVRDFDIYSSPKSPFTVSDIDESTRELFMSGDAKMLSRTRNALTISMGGQTLQFCNYEKPSLKSLVDSFDFAHVQVGIEFAGNGEPPHSDGVYYTDDFLFSNVKRSTFYTGSEYPTSSLIRMFKYAIRGKFPKKEYIKCAIEILTDIVNRGYSCYDDFKDQMDAIDLGLSEYKKTYELFEAMRKRGLVDDDGRETS